MGIFPICDEQQYIFDVNEAIKSVPMKLTSVLELSRYFPQDELCAAVETCIQSADIFSARCIVKDNQQYMEFLQPQKPEIRAFKFATEEEYQIFCKHITENEINNRDKLYHIFVFSIAGSFNHIHFCSNHLIADGISAILFICKIQRILLGEIDEVIWHPFSAYLEKIDLYKKSRKYLSDQKFWEGRFAEISKCEYPFPDVIDIDESTISELIFQTGKTFKTELFAYCSQCRISPHLLILTVLMQFIYRKTGCKKFYFDVPIGNRSGAKEKNSIGLYEIGLPFIFDINKHNNLSDLLDSVKKQAKDYYKHKDFDWYTRMHSEPHFGSYTPQFLFSYFCYSKNILAPFASWRILHPERNGIPITLYISDYIDCETFTFCYTFWKRYFSNDEIVELHEEIVTIIFSMIKDRTIEAHT